jgi:S1-C subfamily serine protease
VAIIEVPEGCAAARAGLKTGDVILQVNRSRVFGLRDLLKAVGQSNDKPITLKVFRQQQPLTLTIQP